MTEGRAGPVGDGAFACALGILAFGFYAAPWTLVYVPCFVGLAALSFLRLRLSLALVPVFAPFVMQPKFIGHLTFAPTELFIGLDVAIALALIATGRTPGLPWRKVRASPFFVPAVLFLAAATLSTLVAYDRHLALHAFRERVLDPLAYAALLLLFVRKRVDWNWILAGVVTGGIAAGVIGLGQFALQRDLSTVNGTGIKRVQSLYGSPDNLGLLFDRVIPIWFVAALLARSRRRLRFALWLGAPLLAIPLVLTFSVGAWIATAAACAAVAAIVRPWGRWAVLLLVLAAGLGIGVKHRSVQHAFQAGHANSTQTRLDVWRSALAMVRDRPVFGAGPDNFQRLYAPTRTQDKYNNLCLPGLGYMRPGAGSEPCLSHPHDEFLDFWLSAGILGLVAYLWLLYVFWRHAIHAYRVDADGWRRALSLSVMAAMLAAIIHGLVDNSYWLVDLSLLFWLLCAAVSWLFDEAAGTSDPDLLPLRASLPPVPPDVTHQRGDTA